MGWWQRLSEEDRIGLTGLTALLIASIPITVMISISHGYNLLQSFVLLFVFIMPTCMGVFMGFTVLSVIYEILKDKMGVVK